MKEKLESFVDEMLKEIKDIKDLAKEELPIVAKEYVTYKRVTSGLGLLVSSIGLLSSIYTAIFIGVGDDRFGFGVCGGAGIFIFGIMTLITADEFLSVMLQPRRTAIEAITKLF